MTKHGDITIESGSGNIFADLGLPGARDMYVKALLALKIGEILKKRKLRQTEAARILGVTQARVSALQSGSKLKDFSIDTLMRFLTKLGQDVEIRVKRKAPSHPAGEITVSV